MNQFNIYSIVVTIYMWKPGKSIQVSSFGKHLQLEIHSLNGESFNEKFPSRIKRKN